MKHPISEYFNRIVIFPSFSLSRDGSKLAYISSLTGSPQVWVGGVSKGQGLLEFPKPVTSDKNKQPYVLGESAVAWIGNDQLACVMDRHGDEESFIEVLNFKTGETFTVDHQPGTRESLGHVSRDRSTLYLTSNRDNPAAQGLFTFSLKTKKMEKWFQHKVFSALWFGEKVYKGHRLFVLMTGSGAITVHAIHPKTKKVIDLYTEPETLFLPVEFMGGDKWLVASNYGRQFLGLAIYNFKTKEFDWVDKDQWDITFSEVSPNRKHLLVVRNVAGYHKVELFTWPKMKKLKHQIPQHGVIEGMSFNEKGDYAVFAFQSPTETRNVYRLNVKTGKVQALTDTWMSSVPQKDLVYPELIQYASQEKKIYSWLYLPKGAKKNGKTPVIVWPHGGPQHQEQATIRPIFQYMVSRGFAVWAPNHTGSTGFGKDFMKAIEGQWGTADLPDMKNGIEWLKKSGWIDPKRMAIMGGSYGGYMTLRSITRLSGVFKAAVDIFGPSSMLTFVKSVPADWMPYMDKLVGHPERDKAKLLEQSPIESLEKIECPLMVIQGAKDPRVVKEESDQLVNALKKRGVEVEYLVFEDEGHGFFKLENELKAYTAAASFLEKHLS